MSTVDRWFVGVMLIVVIAATLSLLADGLSAMNAYVTAPLVAADGRVTR